MTATTILPMITLAALLAAGSADAADKTVKIGVLTDMSGVAVDDMGPGSVLAAQMGYVPGMLWILAGVVFAGAVQDFIVLFMSTRRDGRSLGDLVKMELGTVPGVIGVKTGHTSEAGWSQVAADRRGGVLVYATILGSPSRQQRNADLERLIAHVSAEVRRVHGVALEPEVRIVGVP